MILIIYKYRIELLYKYMCLCTTQCVAQLTNYPTYEMNENILMNE